MPYQLIHADVMVDGKIRDVYLCSSEDFKEKGEFKIALDAYKEREGYEEESALDFCVGKGDFLSATATSCVFRRNQ